MSDQETILLGSISLPSCSAVHGNLTWSALGQALVVTDDILFVLSPLIGIHPRLAAPSRLCDIETHADWTGRLPHASSQIHIKTILDQDSTVRRRRALEADYSDSHPLFSNLRWRSASWSRPGMGPNGSCLILAVTSEMDLYVLGAPNNAWTGDWRLLHSVDLSKAGERLAADARDAHTVTQVITDQDKMMFSTSRNDIRLRQKATEVQCASWLDPVPLTDDLHRGSLTDRCEHLSSTCIVAGLRAGYAVVLRCQAVTGHCTLLSFARLSEWAVDRILLNTSERSESLVKMAFQTADGVFVSPLRLNTDDEVIQVPSLSPILPHQTISHWKWFEHRLVVGTAGRAHVYDSRSDAIATHLLAPSSDPQSDPYSPAISIYQDGRVNGCVVVLQNLQTYYVPFSDSVQRPLEATKASVIKGYPPLLEPFQHEYDALQKYHAFAPQFEMALDASSSHLVGVTLMDERVASFGFNVSETSKYQLLVRYPLEQCMALSNYVRQGVSRLRQDQTPVAALMPLIATLVSKPGTLGPLMTEVIEHAVHAIEALHARGHSSTKFKTPLAQEQALYVLNNWFQVSASCFRPTFSLSFSSNLVQQRQPEAKKVDGIPWPSAFRQRIITSWMQQWIPRLTKDYHKEASDSERRTLLRLIKAAGLLPAADSYSSKQEDCDAAFTAMCRPSQHTSVSFSVHSRVFAQAHNGPAYATPIFYAGFQQRRHGGVLCSMLFGPFVVLGRAHADLWFRSMQDCTRLA